MWCTCRNTSRSHSRRWFLPCDIFLKYFWMGELRREDFVPAGLPQWHLSVCISRWQREMPAGSWSASAPPYPEGISDVDWALILSFRSQRRWSPCSPPAGVWHHERWKMNCKTLLERHTRTRKYCRRGDERFSIFSSRCGNYSNACFIVAAVVLFFRLRPISISSITAKNAKHTWTNISVMKTT